MRFLRSLLAALLLLGAFTGAAQAQSLGWAYNFSAVDNCCGFNNTTTGYIYSSASQACSANTSPDFVVSSITGTDHPATAPTNTTTTYVLTCLAQKNGGQTTTGQSRTKGVCPSTSTYVSGSACACPAGTNWNAASNACEAPNACTPEAGKTITTNFTAGWAINPNADPIDAQSNIVGQYLGPKVGDYKCIPSSPGGTAGCRRFVDAYLQGYSSMEPAASGLYRLSIDYATIGQGTTCTVAANDKASDPNAPNPSCPGAVGQVNGVTRCVPKVGGPALPAPTNPASAPPSGVPVTPGNPKAGDKPDTGTGSGSGGVGRTPPSGGGGAGTNPQSGGGGNSGGSSSGTGGGTTGGPAGSGTGGTTSGGSGGGTTTAAEKPVTPCGLPGSPKCMLDETGTGTGDGALNGANAKFDTEAGKQNTQIGAAGSTVTGVAWNWAFTLPAGACTPFDFSTRLGPVSINPCTNSWFALFRSLMGYFFFGLTGFYIWHKATAAPTGGK